MRVVAVLLCARPQTVTRGRATTAARALTGEPATVGGVSRSDPVAGSPPAGQASVTSGISRNAVSYPSWRAATGGVATDSVTVSPACNAATDAP